MLAPGTKATDFMLEDQDGARIRLAAYHGKPVVLFFYPQDGSRGCTKQAAAFRDSYQEFRDLGAVVLGISRDGSESHREFRRQSGLPFPLLTDREGAVAREYGVPRMLGLMPGRATFVLDASGVVRLAYSNNLNMESHRDEALRAVRRLTEQDGKAGGENDEVET